MLGEFLLQQQAISPIALEEALATQRLRPQPLGRLLRSLGYLEELELNRLLGLYLKPAKCEVTAHSLLKAIQNRKAQSDWPQEIENWARSRSLILLGRWNQELKLLAMGFDDSALEEAENNFDQRASFQIISQDTLSFLLEALDGSRSEGGSREKLTVDREKTDDQRIGASDPYTSLLRDTIRAARDQGASDIHFQPERDGLDIRFRLNGEMRSFRRLGIEHRRPLIQALKRMAKFSIATSGRVQDGRISLKQWNLDLRASLLPSQYGEKIVLRLLDLTRKFELEGLNLDPDTYRDLRGALSFNSGVIIISGPTGSGKTTTLYTLLYTLDRRGRNVITLEDPIEYGIEGLTQVQISKKLTFSDALRGVLRQDPDVILVGEIRDSETADLCVKAASTGHLVLSTIHANGASEVVSRLLHLGVEPYLLRTVLRFSGAQRLIPKLCQHCSLEVSEIKRAEVFGMLPEVKGPMNSGIRLKTRSDLGCAHCQGGVRGRTSVMEYLTADQLAKVSLDPAGSIAPKKSLQQAVLNHAVKGEVDYREIFQNH